MEDNSPIGELRMVRTRKRRPVVCQPCRKKKLRCDRNMPCSNCTRSRNGVCTYALGEAPIRNADAAASPQSSHRSNYGHEEVQNQPPSPVISKSEEPRVAANASAGSTGQTGGGENATWYSSAVASLLITTPLSTTATQVATAKVNGEGLETSQPTTHGGSAAAADDGSGHHVPFFLGELTGPIRNIMVKTRYLSPSSWLYSTLLTPHTLVWIDKINREKDESWQALKACKQLSTRLKAQQDPKLLYGGYGKLFPLRALGDILIGSYLRTFETVHRIVHVPSFMRDYELLWDNFSSQPSSFIVQVQLCFALGALVFDDGFTLRSQALQWVHEAETWLESSAKPRMTTFTIQAMCLLDLVRENTHGTYGDRFWIRSGSLLRAAMSIGLHRDPSKLPTMPRAQAEMRRRLWATIIELVLDSCIDPGAPPLISLDDFDCELPSNFNDSQLHLDVNDNPVPQTPDVFTDSSLQIALGVLFPIRLAIAKFSNGIKAESSYQETIDLSVKYTTACRSFVSSLQGLQSGLSPFQSQYCDMIICRYTYTLHIPHLIVGSKSSVYLLSRKACVEAATRLAHSALPFSLSTDQQQQPPPPLLVAIRSAIGMESRCDDIVRLFLCGSGPKRSVLLQTIMVIAAELVVTAEELKSSFRCPSAAIGAHTTNDSGSPASASIPALPTPTLPPPAGNLHTAELLSLLRLAMDWTRHRIRAGQDPNRDHVYVALALSSIEALMAGGDSVAVGKAMDAHGRDACLESQSILAEMAGLYAGVAALPTAEGSLLLHEDTSSSGGSVTEYIDLWDMHHFVDLNEDLFFS